MTYNKTDGHDRTVILLKVALNIISPNPIFSFSLYADDSIHNKVTIQIGKLAKY
jgi:hypothetical protein